ncbi:peptide ABC transporter permease [Clostridia bacterium]|nr:peptide ABC transporter permease [Clostridia bacterium]
MVRYTIKRLLQSVFTVLLVVTIVFLLLRMMPTDYYFTEDELIKLTDVQKHDRLQAAGLLDPPLTQLGRFYTKLFTKLDLGTSRRVQANKPVVDLIASKFSISMRLGLTALGIALAIGVVLGVLQARFKDGIIDNIGTAYTIFINAVPSLVSYSLVLAFGARILGLPSMYSVRKPGPSSILPIVCLAMGSLAGYMLWIRRYMVDELNKDYIHLAKLKGLSTRSVMFRHVLRNAFVPLAQYLPYSILLTVGGSLLVERFFSVPGMGPLLTDAISRYDTNVVQAIVMLYASLGILGVFLGDVLMTLIDPRIRLTAKEVSR